MKKYFIFCLTLFVCAVSTVPAHGQPVADAKITFYEGKRHGEPVNPGTVFTYQPSPHQFGGRIEVVLNYARLAKNTMVHTRITNLRNKNSRSETFSLNAGTTRYQYTMVRLPGPGRYRYELVEPSNDKLANAAKPYASKIVTMKKPRHKKPKA